MALVQFWEFQVSYKINVGVWSSGSVKGKHFWRVCVSSIASYIQKTTYSSFNQLYYISFAINFTIHRFGFMSISTIFATVFPNINYFL